MDMNTIVSGVSLSKACSIRPDKDSEEHKMIKLQVNFDGVTLQSVFDKALSSAVISWQNGTGRKRFDDFKNGEIVEVEFRSPGRFTVDPEDMMKARLRAMTLEERKAKIQELIDTLD